MNITKKIAIAVIIVLIAVVLSALYIGNFTNKEPENKTAHIVFTSDKYYKEYLKVALKSAILNKNPQSVYDINILCVDLNENEMNEYKQMETDNVKINPRLVSLATIKNIGDFPVSNHVSRADLFKFFMPDILSEYDKVLYVDSDTLVLGDLLDLYNTDISNKYLGAVIKYAPAYSWKKIIGLIFIRYEKYDYNCGIMLLNLKKMREDDITQKLIIAKNKDELRALMTQDAFNEVIPLKTIKKLSPVYNLISRWKKAYFHSYNFKKTYSPYLRDINSMEELYKKAVIVHYAGYKKPWYYPDVEFADEWWKYAKMINKDWKPIPDPNREANETFILF